MSNSWCFSFQFARALKTLRGFDLGSIPDFFVEMKRADGIGDGESEQSGLKKTRLADENESGGADSVVVDKKGDIFGDLFSDDLVGRGLGGLNKSNGWDVDINSDLNFGDEDEWQDGLAFDLNLPAVKESRVDFIDIASDNSDDEVEVIGYNNGGANLSLGIGMTETSNFVGESNMNGDRRYTREEKGKTTVVDSWLSHTPDSPTVLHLFPGIYDPIRPSEPREESPARPETAESSIGRLRQALEDARNREKADWKETAKRFAVTHLQDEKQQLPAASPPDQLGNRPGAFSEALSIIRKRTSKHPAVINWTPSMAIRDRNITTRFVPSLLDLSLKALAENADRIVSLELVPDNLRERLSDRLCDTSKMNVHAMNLLVEGCATEIRIKNCSWLTEQQFQKIFGSFRTKPLRVLQLDFCGQCMLDFAFKDLLSHSSNGFSSLAILSLRGACRLSDGGLKALLLSAPSLRSINLGHCNLLTSNAISFIADTLGSNLRELYIDDCQKINPVLILPAFNKFPYLEVLSVARMHSITDQFISQMVTACGRTIKELDLADCRKLTDCSMKAIGSNCADLISLNISNMPNLTDLAIEYLANGCKSIRKLNLCRNGFSDEAMAAYIESSGDLLTELSLNNLTKMGQNTAMSLAKCSRKLLSLDISWCRKITNEALGLIVDSCSSLKLLKVFGCRQITDVFLNGHSNPGVRIVGLSLTPIFDHVNLLEPEGVLLRYSALSDSQ